MDFGHYWVKMHDITQADEGYKILDDVDCWIYWIFSLDFYDT